MTLTQKYTELFNRIDTLLTRWMAANALTVVRIGLGIVFFWFGALKLFPGLSPAEELVRNTTAFVNPVWFIPLLAVWEMMIGLGLISGKAMRLTLLLLFLQMPGTAMPLIVATYLPFKNSRSSSSPVTMLRRY